MNASLREQSTEFDFAQAAILLQRRGGDRLTGRFAGSRTLGFPAAELELSGDDAEARLLVGFLGLTGTMGVLPAHYSELIEERRRGGDPTLGQFLEIFEHRITELFIGAHVKNRFWLDFARTLPQRASPHALTDRVRERAGSFEELLFALVGRGRPATRGDVGVPPVALLHYSGLLSQRPRSASALVNILADLLSCSVEIRQLMGSWVDIPDDQRSLLGQAAGCRLGNDLFLGDRYFEPSLGFRLRFGPVGRDQLLDLLPGGAGARLLEEFVPYFAGPDLLFDYEVVVRAEDVVEARLTGDGLGHQRLGQSLWLFSSDEHGDAVAGPFVGDRSDRTRTWRAPSGVQTWSKSA